MMYIGQNNLLFATVAEASHVLTNVSALNFTLLAGSSAIDPMPSSYEVHWATPNAKVGTGVPAAFRLSAAGAYPFSYDEINGAGVHVESTMTSSARRPTAAHTNSADPSGCLDPRDSTAPRPPPLSPDWRTDGTADHSRATADGQHDELRDADHDATVSHARTAGFFECSPFSVSFHAAAGVSSCRDRSGDSSSPLLNAGRVHFAFRCVARRQKSRSFCCFFLSTVADRNL
jgi:hypothetical protein